MLVLKAEYFPLLSCWHVWLQESSSAERRWFPPACQSFQSIADCGIKGDALLRLTPVGDAGLFKDTADVHMLGKIIAVPTLAP